MERPIDFHPDLPSTYPISLPTSSLPLMRDVKPSETNSSDKPKEPQSAPAPPPAPSDPFCVTATAREQGRKMGSAFANLGGESIARARDMSDAIQRGKTEADNHDAYEQFACTDTDELRSRGFYGVDKDF